MGKTVLWIILLALCLVLAGCSPQAQEGAALEGVLFEEMDGYASGEGQWLLVQPEGKGDVVTLFTLPEEAAIKNGPLKEGQKVKVTCQTVLEIGPPMMENVSHVEVLGEPSARNRKKPARLPRRVWMVLPCPRKAGKTPLRIPRQPPRPALLRNESSSPWSSPCKFRDFFVK